MSPRTLRAEEVDSLHELALVDHSPDTLGAPRRQFGKLIDVQVLPGGDLAALTLRTRCRGG